MSGTVDIAELRRYLERYAAFRAQPPGQVPEALPEGTIAEMAEVAIAYMPLLLDELTQLRDQATTRQSRANKTVLFVGGPRHGTTTPDGTPTPPPALWRDLTGEHWALGEIACDLKTLATGQPEGRWRVPLYLHPSVPQAQHLPAYLDALNYWHLHTHGQRVDQDDIAPKIAYVALCPECPDLGWPGVGLLFHTLTDRATWARQHIDATGHKLEYSQREETRA